MKGLIYVMLLTPIFLSCGNSQKKNNPSEKEEKTELQPNRVEVIYFHGAQRCITCRAIEENTIALLDSLYAEDMKKGNIVYKSIDISKKENKKIADKYEVTWSSLFINKWKEGEETPNNMTEFAFSYAKGFPEKFKEGIKEKITELKK